MSKSRDVVAKPLRLIQLFAFIAGGLVHLIFGQPIPAKWNSGLPLKPTRTIEFTTDEGTGMSVDVSPDGSTVVFDLLGDLYSVPIGGGNARQLTSGMAIDGYPRFSPDGSHIAFVSDRSGIGNVWMMRVDGSDPKMLTRLTDLREHGVGFAGLNWSSNGRELLVNIDLLSTTPVFVRVDTRSGQVTLNRSDQNRNAPAPAEWKGEHIWFTRSGPSALLKTDLAMSRSQIYELDKSLPTSTRLDSVTVSPDGRFVAYRVATLLTGGVLSQLRLRDYSSKDSLEGDRIIGTCDQAEYSIIQQIAFTPDSKGVICASDGKLKLWPIETGKEGEIPFEAHVKIGLGPLNEPPAVDLSGPIRVKQIHSINATSDGRTIVFDAIGKVWIIKDRKEPRRISETSETEYNPVISPDGKWIAYCTWSFAGGGRLWKRSLSAGPPIMLAVAKEAFSAPRWTHDGTQIVAWRFAAVLGGAPAIDPKLPSLVVAHTGEADMRFSFFGPPIGDAWKYPELPKNLSVTRDGEVYYCLDVKGDRWVYSMPIGGGEIQVRARIRNASFFYGVEVAVSPNGTWLAIWKDFNIFVMRMPRKGGEAPILDVYQDPSVRRLTTIGGGQPIWSADGKWLTWSWANKMFRLRASDIDLGSSKVGYKKTVTTIDLTVPRGGSKGKLFLTNARIVTMAERGSPTVAQTGGIPMRTDPVVIEKGDLLIEGARIKAIAPSRKITPPADAKLIDVAGKTIVPGYLSLHEHAHFGRLRTFTPEQTPWSALLVASGFAATQDPWHGFMPMYAAEMIEAGEMVGPHVLNGLQGTSNEPPITNYTEAQAMVRKHKSSGAFLLKDYFGIERPDHDTGLTFSSGAEWHRIQRQWVVLAARRFGLSLTTEGGGLQYDMGLAADGWNATAHAPFGRSGMILKKDVLMLQELSGVDVQGIHPSFQTLLRSTPERTQKVLDYVLRLTDANWVELESLKATLRGRSVGKPGLASDGSEVPYVSRYGSLMSDLIASGVRLSAGTDSETPYLSAHRQIWDSVMTGQVSTAEALRMFTINPARSLRVNKDLGSVEVGKLADLVILNSNPLDEITSTADILYVIRMGEVYDPKSLDVLWPTTRKFNMFPWARRPKVGNAE